MDKLKLKLQGEAVTNNALPAALASATRSASGVGDPFLNPQAVSTKAVYDLSPTRRAAAPAPAVTPALADDDVLALETMDGATLFISAQRLRESGLRREAMEGDALALDSLREPGSSTRGIGGALWSKVSVLELKPDELIRAAEAKAVELAAEWLKGLPAKGLLDGASWVGARALSWAIESRLLAKPGVYRWVRAEGKAGDLATVTKEELRNEAAAGPLLLFIHGTGSNTSGSFGDLAPHGRDWAALTQRYGSRVFAFEHYSLSESPVENAIQLANALPDNARISLVTHSRGGLIGDLLCLAGLPATEISSWKRHAAPGVKADEIDKVTQKEQELLRELSKLLAQKNFQIERYVRVAAPARGTLLATGNFDVFLSALLTAIGMVSGLKASGLYSGFARLVLEIVKRRMDPQVVPGIEAMLPQAPLPLLLSRAARQPGVRMAVIAGDVEGGSIWQRLGVLFTDWMFFDRFDNDLVVNTDSMFEGLARAGEGAHFLFDQGAQVTHFHYFRNARTQRAVRAWLSYETGPLPADFQPLAARGALSTEVATRSRSRGLGAGDISGKRPIVVMLPGTMGSHLRLRVRAGKPTDEADRLWFDLWGLRKGALGDLRWDKTPAAGQVIEPDGLFDKFYGDLCEHLEATHDVVRFPYDWRAPIQQEAKRLADTVEELLKQAAAGGQPVRLLAHSMGGLVCRTMIAQRPDLWQKLSAHKDSRFVMLGTPNQGSHLMVQQLIGKASTTRMLAALDSRHDLAGILDIVASMPGALQLMPRPGFTDTAGEQEKNYFDSSLWQRLRKGVRDRWIGDGVVAQPKQACLDQGKQLWESVLKDNQVPEPADRICYVFGVARETPCGLRTTKDGQGKETVQLLTTPLGDGSVTWESGRLEGLRGRYWYMQAGHGDLACTHSAFGAIVDLLQRGHTQQLDQVPPATRAAEHPGPLVYEAPPPMAPTEEELAAGLFGDPRASAPRPRKATSSLRISVTAGDLRFVSSPVLCGHYPCDPIAGPEAVIDENIVFGGLRERERLGLYPGPIGTSAIVVMPASETQQAFGIRRGAVIVGLGDFGKLSAPAVTETVRAGVLRFLLWARDTRLDREVNPASAGLKLSSLLIGHNSTTSITAEDSMAAIVVGVMEANRQFEEGLDNVPGQPVRPQYVDQLEFIELYLDTAISAVHASRDLPQRLKCDLQRLGVSLEAEAELQMGGGARQRLSDSSGNSGYWPRIVVTDADHRESDCPPECFESHRASAMLEEEAGEPLYAERLRFLFLSERARAETIVHQRQPRLLETLVANAVRDTRWNRELSATLFQLMVPVDFKDTARTAERLVLVVDGSTANLPWEMMAAEGVPLVKRTRMVRQLASPRFRPHVRTTSKDRAYVVGEPSTENFFVHFPQFARSVDSGSGTQPGGLAPLPGAEKETDAVRQILEEAAFSVISSRPGSEALDVISRLYQSPYRIIHIAAHGLYNVAGRDGKPRTGVVLSDGLMLTAAEISQMEVVPELVFLNCCHLGKADNLPRESRRIAYSLSRELIEMGVRCVIAAGWEVEDAAGQLFAETFYRSMLQDGLNFGDAVHKARGALLGMDSNTWGAYQAYGDPAFFIRRIADDGKSSKYKLVSPLELIDAIDTRTTRLRRSLSLREKAAMGTAQQTSALAQADIVTKLIEDVPGEWLERADVQAALGRFWGDLGDFERARVAYMAALASAEPANGVTVQVIEQLANLEARSENLDLVEMAIRRLEGLIGSRENPFPLTSERVALLGSAYKCKATLLEKRGDARALILECLAQSRDAYARRGIDPDASDFRPYNAINYAQLSVVLGDGTADPQVEAIVLRAQEAAAQQFKRSRDFFDAVMPVDAALGIAMLKGTLADAGVADGLIQQYGEAVRAVPSQSRNIDSVIRQLKFLAKLRGSAEAKVLARIVDSLAPIIPPVAASAAAPVREPVSESASQPRRQAKPKSGSKATPKTTLKARAKAPQKGRRTPGKKP